MIRVIAIDGVAGSGKSTLAKSLARELQWAYFDTGAMYRAVALACIRYGADPTDEDQVVKIANTHAIYISRNPDGVNGLTLITLDDVDISADIRTPEVGIAVAQVAVHKQLRSIMVALQQEWIREHGDSVVEGRDISAVVWPEAILKIYLTADLEERAKRRTEEFVTVDPSTANSDVVAQLANRDESDSTKGGLSQVGDAIEIDTTHDTPAETLKRVMAIIPK